MYPVEQFIPDVLLLERLPNGRDRRQFCDVRIRDDHNTLHLQLRQIHPHFTGNTRSITNARCRHLKRVIFGTAAVKKPSLIEEAVKKYDSESIAVAIDEKDGKVAVHGWQNKSEKSYIDFACSFEKMGVGALIFTPISVDGTLKGPGIEKTVKLVEAVNVPVIASGGVARLEDLIALSETGVEGVVVGTALYEKKFTLEEALEAVKNC